jgi:hypothetical protein
MSRKLLHHKFDIEFISEIKADVGYFVLELYKEPDEVPEVFFHPVYAWAIEGETFAPYPITNAGIQVENLQILRPDGIVYSGFEDGQYDSLDEWLAGMNSTGAILHNGVKK